MKKALIFLLALCLVADANYAVYSDDEYDPQHTMLALNMAIVSVHRIL